MSDLKLDPSRSALVLVDLQNGVLALKTAPRSGEQVLDNAVRLLKAFRDAGGLVVLVRVAFSADGKDALSPAADITAPAATRPPEWAELSTRLEVGAGDLVVTKRQWGAFHGTELDLQLRRRGIDTLVLGGIATHIGVESTARAAYEHGYRQVFVEDAMASTSEETHAFPLKAVFPRIGRVRDTQQVVQAL
ncbi:MAG: hydrolase, partial [Burkholderiaceae bacterium]